MDRLGIVTRSYSYSLFVKVTALLIAGALAVAAIVYLSVERQIGGDYAEALYSLHQLKAVLLSRTLLVGLGIGLLIVSGVAAVNLFYSHRVAGPLFRIDRELARIAEGDLSVRVRLRQRDVVVPLAEEVSALAEQHGRRVSELRQACDDLTAKAEALAAAAVIDEDAIRETRRGVDALREAVSEIRL